MRNRHAQIGGLYLRNAVIALVSPRNIGSYYYIYSFSRTARAPLEISARYLVRIAQRYAFGCVRNIYAVCYFVAAHGKRNFIRKIGIARIARNCE